jgi:Trk K+ transport system NAD-binding subunit
VPPTWAGLAVDAQPPASLHGLVVVLALRDVDGREERTTATPDLVLQDGWRVVVLGSRDAIDRLAAAAHDDDEDDDGSP